MTSETNITSIPVFSEIPSLITDKTGKIIALNSEFKKLITTAIPQANFFELFDEQKVQILQKVFSEARKRTLFLSNMKSKYNFFVVTTTFII